MVHDAESICKYGGQGRLILETTIDKEHNVGKDGALVHVGNDDRLNISL